MRDVLYAFLRGMVQAGIASAALFLTGNLDATNTQELVAGLALAFIAGVIGFAGAYLREQATPVPARAFAGAAKPKSKLDWLPF